MGAAELLGQLRSCGVSVALDRDELVLRPGSKVPARLLFEVRQRKSGILAVLTAQESKEPTAWPPPDTADLLAQWKDVGRPSIALSPGVSIVSLERWFYPVHGRQIWSPLDLAKVRRFLRVRAAWRGDPS